MHFRATKRLKHRLEDISERSGLSQSSICRRGVLSEILKLEKSFSEAKRGGSDGF